MGAQKPYTSSGKICSYDGCDRPAWSDCPQGRCLFHSPENGRDAETARLVWNTARAMAIDKGAKSANFRGWHFPGDPDAVPPDRGRGKGAFVGTSFASWADFGSATFDEGAWFSGAMFRKGARFSNASLSGAAIFEGAHFSGEAIFDGAHFSGEAIFDGADFSGAALFEGVTFSHWPHFQDATFSGGALFNGSKFIVLALFDRATFGGVAWFDNSTFADGVSFTCATFDEDASFARTKLHVTAWFKGATFSNEARFDWAVAAPGATVVFDPPCKRSRPFRNRREGETAYRLAKQAAQAAGDYTEAGRYHYAEQCAIEDRWRYESGMRPWHRAFWVWAGRLAFGRTVFGYGERPSHPLLLGLAVVAIWTGLYFGFAGIAPSNLTATAPCESYSPSFSDAAYFSIVTFTTLGYGDFQPKPGFRLLAGAEAALGAALMATFVVCLTRKYMR